MICLSKSIHCMNDRLAISSFSPAGFCYPLHRDLQVQFTGLSEYIDCMDGCCLTIQAICMKILRLLFTAKNAKTYSSFSVSSAIFAVNFSKAFYLVGMDSCLQQGFRRRIPPCDYGNGSYTGQSRIVQ